MLNKNEINEMINKKFEIVYFKKFSKKICFGKWQKIFVIKFSF